MKNNNSIKRTMMLSPFLLTIFLAVIVNCSSDPRRLNTRVVTTKYGAMRGYITTLNNRHLQPVEFFLGVPYASSPTGSLRFMPPVTPSHWRGVKMADRFGPVCPQKYPDIKNETEALRLMPPGRYEYLRRLIHYLKNQSEDCLYLNIYAPAVVGREPAKLPVMVFIHGESYEWNSGNAYDGSVLASYGNVVVVTINYRLGVLGFLPTLDGSGRGNYGLMDQIAALHWVQENIYEFGGNPNMVTVFGQGHGAACVNFLMVSPMAKGLFKRAILQSGSALSPWAVAREASTFTRHLARTLGCSPHDSTALVECMRQKPLPDIMRVQLLVPDHLTAFGPTVDGIVIPGEPKSLMEEYNPLFSEYDLMFGTTRVESYFQFSAHEERYGIEEERRDRLLRTLIRNLYTYHLQEIFLTVVNEYTDWTRPVQHPINVFDGTADAIGDALVVAPVVEAGGYHAKGRIQSYQYVMNHQTEEGDYPTRLGCIQGEELPYVLGAPLVNALGHFTRNYTRAEVQLSEAVMTFWTNFAKAGDPNSPASEPDASGQQEKPRGRFEKVAWPAYENVHQKYMTIGMKPKVKDHYHAHKLSFWLKLIPKLHRPGDPPVSPQHHLFENHQDPNLYDGIVRQVPNTGNQAVLTTHDPMNRLPNVFPGPTSSFNLQELNNAQNSQIQPVVNQGTATKPPTTGPKESPHSANDSDYQAVVMHHSGYSTALSVTIAVGCSLLILNVLIFAGIYYQRDKNRIEAKLQKRNYQVAGKGFKEESCGVVGGGGKIEGKPIPLKTGIGAHHFASYPSQEFIPPPPPPANAANVNMNMITHHHHPHSPQDPLRAPPGMHQGPGAGGGGGGGAPHHNYPGRGNVNATSPEGRRVY